MVRTSRERKHVHQAASWSMQGENSIIERMSWGHGTMGGRESIRGSMIFESHGYIYVRSTVLETFLSHNKPGSECSNLCRS